MSVGYSREERLPRVQEVLEELQHEISNLGLPPLGPGFVDLESARLPSALVGHRLTSKFSKPESTEDLASISIQNMILQDNCGPTAALNWHGLDDRTRLDLIRAKHEIADLLGGFKLPRVATRFPKGESNRTSQGEVSFAAKFSIDQQWTVGASSIGYAAQLCYNTPSLKKMLKEHAYKLYPKRYFEDGVGGFPVYLRMFKAVCDVECARLTTIRKDNEWDRVISMEPTFSMICQLAVSDGLRKCLWDKWSYRVEDRAALHASMLKIGPEWATIDLKNASNSNWRQRVIDMWPSRVVRQLEKHRSCTFEYGTERGVRYFSPRMLSPMGNGFTFEVMTISLLALVRALDPLGSVFGDDIIIRRQHVPRLMNMLSALGWQVNATKSFWEGNFRESCGAFFDHGGNGYIKSFDLEYPMDDLDSIVATNKLYLILQAKQVCPDMRKILIKAWYNCYLAYEAFATTPGSDPEGDGVFSPFPHGLRVNRQHDEKFVALFHRRPVWRLSCKVRKHISQVTPAEWTHVASRMLGQAERPPSRDKRCTYVELVDDITGWTHQRLSEDWYCEVP